MFPLRVLLRLRRWGAVVPIAGLAIALGCQGPDEFFRYSDANQVGTAGSSAAGVAGTTGTGGGSAGTGGGAGSAVGVGGSTSGTGNTVGTAGSTGAGGSGTGSGGSASPAGAGGSVGAGGSYGRGGAAGSMTTGVGGATGAGGVTGAGGSGSTGRGGAVGTAGAGGGATGTAGTGGGAGSSVSGRGGSSTGGTTGAGGGAAGTTGAGGGAGATVDRIQVVALCQPDVSAQEIKVHFKVFNPGSVTKQWSDIKVRYYFTLTTQVPPSITFDYALNFSTTALTMASTATTTYVEVGFPTGSGSLNAFDNVAGSGEIQLRLFNYSTTTWNTDQTDDYSYKSCAGVTDTTAYTSRTTMPGYYQGQLAWGAEPPQ